MAVWRTLIALLALAAASAAQDSRGLALAPPAREARTALVIGNGAYRTGPLKNPVRDAQAMGEALRACGFRVDLVTDAGRERMFAAVRGFGEALKGGGVGLFYFAGHGVQVKGRNYLVPVDADLTSAEEAPYAALDVEAVLDKLEAAGNRLNLIILDACRNNPFGAAQRGGAQGLAQLDAPAGTLLAYATAPGRTAADGGAGDHGLYTGLLLEQLAVPGLRIEDVFKRVRTAVLTASSGQQVPWESSSLTGDFYFKGGPTDTPPPAPAPPRPVPLPGPGRQDGRFVAHGDGTVTDTRTGLMWADHDSSRNIAREEAQAYCAGYRGGGHADWRLPTAEELATLHDGRRPRPAACNPSISLGVATDLIDISCAWVWSSETRRALLGNTARGFSFVHGMALWLQPKEGFLRRALPVRKP